MEVVSPGFLDTTQRFQGYLLKAKLEDLKFLRDVLTGQCILSLICVDSLNPKCDQGKKTRGIRKFEVYGFWIKPSSLDFSRFLTLIQAKIDLEKI